MICVDPLPGVFGGIVPGGNGFGGVPRDFPNLELMLKSVLRASDALLSGTCVDARGRAEPELVEGKTKRHGRTGCAKRRS